MATTMNNTENSTKERSHIFHFYLGTLGMFFVFLLTFSAIDILVLNSSWLWVKLIINFLLLFSSAYALYVQNFKLVNILLAYPIHFTALIMSLFFPAELGFHFSLLPIILYEIFLMSPKVKFPLKLATSVNLLVFLLCAFWPQGSVIGDVPVDLQHARIVSSTMSALALLSSVGILFFYRRLYQLKVNALRKMNKEKDRMVSIISHELRSPLVRIKGLLDLQGMDFEQYNIEESSIKSSQRMLQSSADEALFVSEDIMLSFGKQQFNYSDLSNVHVTEMIKNVVDNTMTAFRGKDLEIQISIENTSLTWLLEERRFRRILINLLDNACKFSQIEGVVSISAKCVDNSLVIAVIDHGIGFSQHLDMVSLTEIYESGKKGTSGERTYGLGLEIVRSLVAFHKGVAWVTSAPNEGATIVIQIPDLKEETS